MKKTRQVFFFTVAILLFLVLLFTRMFYLQVVKGEEFRSASEQNRTRLIFSRAIRGTIYDRNMAVLTKDLATYAIKVVPEDFRETALPLLSEILAMPAEEIQAKLEDARLPSWEPITLRSGLGEDVVQKVEEQHLQLPGVSVQIEPQRFYPYRNLFSHLIGYIGEISPEELSSNPGLESGDLVGKTGLEKKYDGELRGQNGGMIMEVNALGQPIRVLHEEDPTPGNDLILTIDLNLQQKARQILEENKLNGAIVCLDPRNGEILAMASSPDFDPNSFVKGVPAREYDALLSLGAFIPKATQDRFPPGSTFKVITTIAALEEKVVDPEAYTVQCPGHIDVGGHRFYCWQTSGHGRQDLVEALANSCNVFFYTLALDVGPEPIAKWAKIFGLDDYTGIDLADEARGLIPTPLWKKQVLDEPWYPGDTMNMGIGQGDVLVTPLELANAYAAIAMGGVLHVPHLVKEIRTFDGVPLKSTEPTIKREILLSQRTLKYLKEGMVKAAERGTTQYIQVEGIKVAAKTGTALITDEKQDIWIAAYAPIDKPEIVVLLMDEYSKLDYGSYLAPFAHELLSAYFTSSGEVTP